MSGSILRTASAIQRRIAPSLEKNRIQDAQKDQKGRISSEHKVFLRGLCVTELGCIVKILGAVIQVKLN